MGNRQDAFVVYSMDTKKCKYCRWAYELLHDQMVDFETRDIARQDHKDFLTSNGFTTVPQIWIGDTYIGGYTDLCDHFKVPARTE
jgi:glutaredoxin